MSINFNYPSKKKSLLSSTLLVKTTEDTFTQFIHSTHQKTLTFNSDNLQYIQMTTLVAGMNGISYTINDDLIHLLIQCIS